MQEKFHVARDQVGTCSMSTLLDVDLVSSDVSSPCGENPQLSSRSRPTAGGALAAWLMADG
jgi:hypothetical protein